LGRSPGGFGTPGNLGKSELGGGGGAALAVAAARAARRRVWVACIVVLIRLMEYVKALRSV
jgi:hypothetical protein